MNQQPQTTSRCVRIEQICNNPAKNMVGILNMSKTSFWNGVKKGFYPQPHKINARVTVWNAELIEQVAIGTYPGLKNIDQTKHSGRKPKSQQA